MIKVLLIMLMSITLYAQSPTIVFYGEMNNRTKTKNIGDYLKVNSSNCIVSDNYTVNYDVDVSSWGHYKLQVYANFKKTDTFKVDAIIDYAKNWLIANQSSVIWGKLIYQTCGHFDSTEKSIPAGLCQPCIDNVIWEK